jgi:hypothetical protein
MITDEEAAVLESGGTIPEHWVTYDALAGQYPTQVYSGATSANVSSGGNVAGVGAGIGNATGGFVDNLFTTVQKNPLPFLIAGIAIALYMTQPGGGSYRR